jgi:aspartyl-tRNA(Asn)/glutamyl-tRNA(Gln) amidotransferase subunit A
LASNNLSLALPLAPDASELAARIRAGELTAVEAVRAHLARAERLNPSLNAIVTFVPDAEERAARAPAGPLHGVPFTVKDTFDTAGVRTTRGSLLFADRVPARDAAAVALLVAAGAVPIGKTNTPELALWWETDNLVFGRTVNPHDPKRTAGGSSGGEAAAVVSGMSALGLGSDLGGSIRLPAHYCGTVGLKPTHGLVPLAGHWPAVPAAYWHAGFLTRSVRDAELALALFAAPGPPPPERPRVAWTTGALGPVADDVAAAVAQAADALGAEEVELPGLARLDCNELTLRLYGAETGPLIEEVAAGRLDELHPRLRARLALPRPTPDELAAATAEVRELRRRLAALLARYDLLLCQTAPTAAHPHDLDELVVGGVAHHPRTTMRATIPFDLTGSPAISVPWTHSAEGLPIGVQLVARHGEERTLLAAARRLEAVRGAQFSDGSSGISASRR